MESALRNCVATNNITGQEPQLGSLADSGPGSLRQAIVDAFPGDRINFIVTGTIALTSGQLVVDKDLTITGPGASNGKYGRSGLFRVVMHTQLATLIRRSSPPSLKESQALSGGSLRVSLSHVGAGGWE